MTSRKNIEKLIEKAENEIVDLNKQIELKVAYCQGLRDTLRFLPKDAQGVGVTLRSGSELEKVRQILRDAGSKLHINDILKALGKEPTKENRAGLGSSLGSYVRKGEIFTRPGPNIFGLVEMDNSQDEPDLPDDFGVETKSA